MRGRSALLIALLAGVTACSSTHYVTVAGKSQRCVNTTTHKVVSGSHCETQTPTDSTWFYLLLMNNGTNYNVPPPFYNSTTIGTKLNEDDEDLNDEVDEDDGTISDAPSDDNQDGVSGDDDGDGGGSDGDDGGGDDSGGGGDDGGGGGGD